MARTDERRWRNLRIERNGRTLRELAPRVCSRCKRTFRPRKASYRLCESCYRKPNEDKVARITRGDRQRAARAKARREQAVVTEEQLLAERALRKKRKPRKRKKAGPPRSHLRRPFRA